MDMTDKTPLVSVIMPAYNAALFIEEAINSVILQTFSDWELIVIDDCSEDASFFIAEKMALLDSRIIPLRNEINVGVANTRNRGIDLARGKYIAFLDSDDVWHPEKLQCQLKRMEESKADICYCSYAIIDSDGNKCKPDYKVPYTVSYEDILRENCIQCSAMLIPTEIVKKFKFNTQYYHEDYVLNLDILGQGGYAAGCTEILLKWRYLENSRSFDKRKSAFNRWEIYRKYLKLPLLKTCLLFAGYAVAGMRKYLRKSK